MGGSLPLEGTEMEEDMQKEAPLIITAFSALFLEKLNEWNHISAW